MSERKEIEKFPYAECPKCKELMPVQITEFEKEVDGGIVAVDIVHCGSCKTVLNYDKSLALKWLTRKEAKKLGWTITEIGKKESE